MKTLNPEPRTLNFERWAVLLLLISAFQIFSVSAFAQGLSGTVGSADTKPPQLLVVTLTTGANTNASLTNLFYTAATFYGYKGYSTNAVPTNNSGSVAVGFADTDGRTTNAGSPIFVDSISAGSWLALSKVGAKRNLKDIYFNGATGDKVVILFEK